MIFAPILRYSARHSGREGFDLGAPESALGIEKAQTDGRFLLTCFRPALPSSWEATSMKRIHQRVSSRQHEGWYGFDVRSEQGTRRAIWVLAVLALLASWATAQSTSLLNGSVSDPSGAAVAGAKITLTEPATGLQRITTSNASGLYQFLDVPPGKTIGWRQPQAASHRIWCRR